MNEIYFYSVQIGFFQWEKLSPLVPENSLELKQHRREILSMPQWFDFALTLTKGSWHLIRDGHQYSPAQNTLAHRSKKQTTAPLSRGSKFLGDFITDFPRAHKFERRQHASCTSPIMHLIYPKFCTSIAFNFSWEAVIPRRNDKQMLCKILGGK